MGLDEENSRFFFTPVNLHKPREGERFAAVVTDDGRIFIASGSIVELDFNEAHTINEKSRYGPERPGIIERITGGKPWEHV